MADGAADGAGAGAGVDGTDDMEDFSLFDNMQFWGDTTDTSKQVGSCLANPNSKIFVACGAKKRGLRPD